MNNVTSHKKELAPEQREELLGALQARFEKKMRRHQGLERANTFSMIAPPKARKASAAFVTTAQGCRQGKSKN
jgi:hypothetical protein